jgi:hypothetical protein
MRYYFFILSVFCCVAFGYAQQNDTPNPVLPNMFSGGAGMTWINGEPFYQISLAPELTFGKFGVGLDVNLRFSGKTQQLRKEDFDEGYDFVRMIRYFRYGMKNDELYARLGRLDYARLGHGSILYLYNNSPSYDNRRVGLEFDMNFGTYGFETVYGDFARAGVFGMRGYEKPLQYTSLASLPVIGEMEAGVTLAGDMRDDARGITFDTTSSSIIQKNHGSITMFGFDFGFPIARMSTFQSTVYIDVVKIIDYGGGTTIGWENNIFGLGFVDIFTRIERRFPGDKFMFNYFDALYEIDRTQKGLSLQTIASQGPGIFGDLSVSLFGTLQVRGTYSKLDDIPKSGILHLATNTGTILPSIVIEAGYDKKYIEDNKDVFTLDERSLLYASYGYKPYPYMTVALVYIWTFREDADGKFIPQKRVESRVTFSYPF